MKSPHSRLIAILVSLPVATGAQHASTRIPIESGAAITPVSVTTQSVTYKGKAALRVEPRAGGGGPHTIALLPHDFSFGTIEVEVSGAPAPGADTTVARGFVGIAFHVQADTQRMQTFYIRPTNGRARDQLRRNHATQYTSEPEWPWHRLRRELPGVYESYADMAPGEWTQLRIVVQPQGAELFVNDGKHPALVVNDLRSTVSDGKLALWVADGTVAYFANLRVTHSRRPDDAQVVTK